MKTILISGGNGFVGTHLCQYLLKQNNNVISIDNNCTGSFENIKDLIDNDNFKFIKADIIKPLNIGDPIDEIYNLACPASPKYYQGKNSIFTTKTSVLGSLNMLELAKRNNAKILQASTSEVYGEPLIHPQTESYKGNVNPIGIRSCYDEGKRCAESLFFDYHRLYDLDIKIARIFNTYGPLIGIDDGRVISNFIKQGLLGKNITIYGDGNQTRSFMFISDLIEGLVKLMNKDDFTEPVNLGNPDDEIKINDLANKIISKIDNSLKISYNDLPIDDPSKRRPDISLAINELNWHPKIDLNEGLDITINYFKDYLSKYTI